ncbi:aldo/keto reductase [Coraliomargarita parva]|uniref:aldo/keto reductase n=1 Tax=Coraliomargarita parva TaxID=3014050 RepID=UPI0022B4BF53|nr:aldo/keto reductase [Coraliomargarita parva]
MQTFVFPETDWNVTRLAYGCGAIGGHWDTRPLDDSWRQRAFTILDASLEAGINFYDHADIYTYGKSEQVFGEYLKANPDLRESIYIQSKCGIRFANTPNPGTPARYDFSYEHIVESVEGSLRRLGIEYLDTLLLHRPDALMEPEEVARALDDLENDGKVRHFGLSNHSIRQMELLRAYIRQPLLINQLQISLAHPWLIAEGIDVNLHQDTPGSLGTGLLDYCRLHGILVQAWSPVGGGAFYHARAGDEPHPKQALLDLVHTFAESYNCSAQAIMLAWLLRHPACIQPILGTLTPERLQESAQAETIQLSRVEWYQLLQAAIGHPVP